MKIMKRKSTVLGLWLVFLIVGLVHADFGLSVWSGGGMVHAQDDDGGGDDGGGDDGGGDDGGGDDGGGETGADDDGANDSGGDDDDGGTGAVRDNDDAGGNPARELTPAPDVTTPRRTRTVETAPPPVFAAGEIVVTNLSDGDLAVLQAEGFVLIERIGLADVAVVLHRLRVPDGLTLDEARDRVRAVPTGATGDFNHYYRMDDTAATTAPDDVEENGFVPPPPRPCTHLNCASLDLIGWPLARDTLQDCKVTVPMGVIDTRVNAEHENLVGANIEVLRLVAEEVDPSKAVHGTAVAALLVGQVPDRAPGLIPEAQLVVVDIFGREGGDERASVASLIKALDLMAERKVKVINMSLAGPPNAALEAALLRLTGPDGAIVLAAAGNGGRGAEVSYPAGYPSVVAVTAVDQRGQVYRRAQRGTHIDLAAPGVEVWSATSISGVKPRTGTSFAVPFASAAAAVLASRNPDATPEALAAELRGLVQDIGPPGADDVFGAGLLSLSTLCAPKIPEAPLE